MRWTMMIFSGDTECIEMGVEGVKDVQEYAVDC